MIGRGLDGSAIQYISALSPVNLSVGGSSAPFDLSEFQQGTVLLHCVSADGTAHVLRSATSDGTFGAFGCSVPGDASGLSVRSFGVNTSNIWHKIQYSNEDAGSMLTSIILVAQGARFVPITKPTNTTVYSYVAAAR
jgi:hypothetical protein